MNYRILGYFENGFRHISTGCARSTRRPISRTCASACCRARCRHGPSNCLALCRCAGISPKRSRHQNRHARRTGKSVRQHRHLWRPQFHRFHTVTNHFYISRPIFLHRPLSRPGRRICNRRCARRSTRPSRSTRSRHRRRPRKRAAIEAAGCEIRALTADEHAQFRTAVTPLLNDARGTYGENVRHDLMPECGNEGTKDAVQRRLSLRRVAL